MSEEHSSLAALGHAAADRAASVAEEQVKNGTNSHSALLGQRVCSRCGDVQKATATAAEHTLVHAGVRQFRG